MTDHSDLPPELTPPPHEPLPGEHKRALREQLLASTSADTSGVPPSHRPGWLVPSLAAAAVVAVVSGGLYLAGGDGSNDSKTPIVPAGTSGATPPPDEPMPKPSPDYPRTHAPDTIGGVFTTTAPDSRVRKTAYAQSTADLPPISDPSAPQSCADAVNEQVRYGHRELAGARETASRSGSFGATYLYESDDAWIVCDDFAAGDGGAPTLLDPHKKSDPYVPNQQTIGISENFIGTAPDLSDLKSQYFAAGRAFDGVQAISYAFPDGHTENAVIDDNFWSMNYQPTGGVLADPDTNVTKLDPITVTVSPTGNGPNQTFTLRWGLGTCGQINHGC